MIAATSAGVVSGVRRNMTTWRSISVSSSAVVVSGVELGDQPLGRDLPVGVGADLRHLVPVRVDIEAHAEPAPLADVGRPEEPLRLLLDQLGLDAGRRGAPDGQPAVLVVVVEEHDERLLAPNEEGRRAVARPLGDLREVQADAPDVGQRRSPPSCRRTRPQCRA